MLQTICKGAISVVFATALTSGAWAQNFVPTGDFEPPVPTGAVTVGAPNSSNFTQSLIRVGSSWDVVASPTSVLSGSQDVQLATGFPAVASALQTNTFFVQAGQIYTVRFQGIASSASSAGLSLSVTAPTGGTILSGGPGVTPAGNVAGITLGTVAQDYFFTFSTAANVANAFITFTGDINPTILGNFVGNFIQLDNISVVVPELNAAAATVPVTLMLGLLLLAYDRRRNQQTLTVCN